MRDRARNQILERFFSELKELIKTLMEKLMLEERELYLAEHPTKGNGYYTRDLLTQYGILEDLKVPRVREGDFHPKLIPYRKRVSLDLPEAILALYATWASTRDISRFLESMYGAFYSPQSICRLTQVSPRGGKGVEKPPPGAGILRHLPGLRLPFSSTGKDSQGTGVRGSGTQVRWELRGTGVLAIQGRGGISPKLVAGGEETVGAWSPGSEIVCQQ